MHACYLKSTKAFGTAIDVLKREALKKENNNEKRKNAGKVKQRQ